MTNTLTGTVSFWSFTFFSPKSSHYFNVSEGLGKCFIDCCSLHHCSLVFNIFAALLIYFKFLINLFPIPFNICIISSPSLWQRLYASFHRFLPYLIAPSPLHFSFAANISNDLSIHLHHLYFPLTNPCLSLLLLKFFLTYVDISEATLYHILSHTLQFLDTNYSISSCLLLFHTLPQELTMSLEYIRAFYNFPFFYPHSNLCLL